MARTGLRMMPTFPSPPLKFRTVSFPQYGFKVGLSKGAFPAGGAQLSRPSGLHPSFVLPRFQTCSSPLCVGTVVRLSTAIRAVWLLYPRGPRSGPVYAVPVHHHLIGPIRPTRRHI